MFFFTKKMKFNNLVVILVLWIFNFCAILDISDQFCPNIFLYLFGEEFQLFPDIKLFDSTPIY